MLKPEYLDRLPDRLVELYAQVEADILMDMAKRISAYDMFIPAALHQYRKVAELGELHERIMERLSAITGIAEQELNRLLTEAGQEAIRNDDEVYQRAGYAPTPFDASPQLREILRDGIEATSGLFQNLTSTTANTAGQQFEDALDRAWMQVSSGAFDYNSAIRMAVKELSAAGIRTVRYPSGHTDHIDVAVRRAVITGVSQTAARLQLKRLDEMEWDLVETTAHDGARPTHEVWQGKRFSRGGEYREKYPDFKKSTGYGTGPGLCGWNCRHHFYPVVEGSEPTYSKEQLEAMKEKRYEYNGHKMTEYEATQQQRYIERQIRRWKREQQAMQVAGLSTEEAAAKVAHWQNTQRDFIRQTGLKRQYGREQIGKHADFSTTSFNKHYAREGKNGIIIREKAGSTKLYPVTQEQIDDILSSKLKNLRMSEKPTYSSRIRTPGKTVIELYTWGEPKRVKQMLIGKQLKDTEEELINTLLHEELEARIALRKTALHKRLFESGSDVEIHSYIDKAIARYILMRGW